MTQQKKSMKRIHKVVVKRMLDTDPDTSYLEQDGFESRYEEYQRGDFGFVGIRADAELWVPAGSSSIMQSVTSGGLWGIESDSSEEYFAEVEKEQLGELRQQLHELGFSQRAITAAFRNIERG